MNIFVCIKQVPDTAAPVKLAADGSAVLTEGIEFVISPYDEYAIEEALATKQKLGKGTVTLVTVGPERCQKALRTGLALGADEAVHLNDPLFEGSDPAGVAKIIAAYLAKQTCDLVWTGKQAVDDDSGMVAQAVAEALNMPHVCEVKKFELAADGATANLEREVEGGSELLTCKLPAVLSAQKGLNEPRYASLKGIMAAKKKNIISVSASDLGLTASDVGPAGCRVKVRKLAYPEEKKGGLRLLQGDVAAQASEAVKILRDELKVI